MSIEFNDINGDLDGHLRRFGCVCSCSDIGHTIAAYWCDDELDWGLTVEFLYSQYRPWYKRVWDAVKFVFFPMMYPMKYDSMMLHPKDAQELHKFLGEYLEEIRARQDSTGS